MKSYIGCICAISLQSEFSDVSLNYLHHSICSHIDSICVFSPQSEISNVSWNCLHKQKHTHIHCMCRIFLQSESSNGSSNCLPSKKRNHKDCTDVPFLGSLWYNCLKFQKRKGSSWWHKTDCLKFYFHDNFSFLKIWNFTFPGPIMIKFKNYCEDLVNGYFFYLLVH